jgi:hypothetical protein
MVRALVLIYEAGKGTEFSSEQYAEGSSGDLAAQQSAAATNTSNSNSASSDSEQQHVIELLAALDSLMQPRPARPDVSTAAGATGDGSNSTNNEYSDDSRARGRSNGTGNTNVVSDCYFLCTLMYQCALR